MNADMNIPLWLKFFNIENILANDIIDINQKDYNIYNPIDYAALIHIFYLKKYLQGSKKLIFVGMNPSFDGMTQNGVPFGNTSTVKNVMGLKGPLINPPNASITGLTHITEEETGTRLWNYIRRQTNGGLETFFEQCFVYNFCPLLFEHAKTKKRIPLANLTEEYREKVLQKCLRETENMVRLVKPTVIVAIGKCVYDQIIQSEYIQQCDSIKVCKIIHPSPLTEMTESEWSRAVHKKLKDEDLLKYLKNSG